MPFKNLHTRRLVIHVSTLHVHDHIFDQHLSEVSFCNFIHYEINIEQFGCQTNNH